MIVLSEIDKVAVKSAQDEELLSEFVGYYESFILKVASKTVMKPVSKNDDEWVIALASFVEAVKNYDYEKGHFFAFAEPIIHKNLMDYYRTERKPIEDIQLEWVDDEIIVLCNDCDLKQEIESLTKTLDSYDFSFMDLADYSPETVKMKIACTKAVMFLMKNPELIKETQTLKKLPVSTISQNTDVSEKTLESYSKYIIVSVEVLLGKYPLFAQYLNLIEEVSVS